MLRRVSTGVLATVLAGCGPWIIEQPTATPPSAPAAAPDEEARNAIAAAFELEPSALVATDDGLVFVARMDGELRLLLAREGDPNRVEVLARAEEVAVAPGTSGASSFAVVCPPDSVDVRYYFFGRDEREVTRVLTGLTGLGGEVVDGLWVLAITDDEIAPQQQWEIVDPLGMARMEAGTGARFASDGQTIGLGDSVLCEVNEH